MADATFDVVFSGELKPGVDPKRVQAQIQARFRLSDQALARLFSGKPVIIKRDLDREKAMKFQKAFSQVGAIVQLVAHGADTQPPEKSSGHPEPSQAPSRESAPSGLRLAPVESGPLEPEPDRTPPKLDTSYLSLVTDENWSLEDCNRPPTPIPTPDTSYLSLAEPEEERQDEKKDPDGVR